MYKNKSYIFLIVILVFIFFEDQFSFAQKQKKVAREGKAMEQKSVVLIIAPEDFRDEEYFEPLKILKDAGIKVKTASFSTGVCTGMLGAKVKSEMLIKDILVDLFDAIIFIGGSGSSIYWDNKDAHKIVQDAIKKDKIVAAICLAPVTLAKAGILKGKSATVFESEIDEIKKMGVIYSGKDVSVDGKIITADGPSSAGKFGKEILNLLTSKK